MARSRSSSAVGGTQVPRVALILAVLALLLVRLIYGLFA